jgi:molybdenum cofactor synthesis domain-containing protein
METAGGRQGRVTETALVITISTRAAAGVYADTSGLIILDGLRDLGFEVTEPLVVPDGDEVGAALRSAVAAEHAVVITTGGTGLHPNDHTPEQTRSVIERDIPQLAAEIARYGVDHGVPTAALSRGVAGTAGKTLIINLAGSAGAARDGMAVLGPMLRHAVSQLHGGDH